MRDEKYLYISDVKEKNSVARSARNRRTHNGKRGGVKLPSDYLTKKELQNMNGECKTYRLNEPMKWNEFIQMPDDIKESYLMALIKAYNPPAYAVAEMFSVHRNTLQRELIRLGISFGGVGRKTWEKEKFIEWAYGVPTTKEEDSVVEEPVTEEIHDEVHFFPPIEIKDIALDEIEKLSAKEELACPRAIPNTGNMVFEGNADSILKTLGVLFGDANVHINVTWDVLE